MIPYPDDRRTPASVGDAGGDPPARPVPPSDAAGDHPIILYFDLSPGAVGVPDEPGYSTAVYDACGRLVAASITDGPFATSTTYHFDEPSGEFDDPDEPPVPG